MKNIRKIRKEPACWHMFRERIAPCFDKCKECGQVLVTRQDTQYPKAWKKKKY